MTVAEVVAMIVAFDIASFPIFRNGDLYYPGVASLLSIIYCGGEAIIFNSQREISRQEEILIGQLAASFEGRIIAARDGKGADMCIS
jgi:hypothetical protein